MADPQEQGPWAHYQSADAGPWTKYGAPPPAAAAADSAEKPEEPGFLDTLKREGRSAVGAVAGIPGSIYHAFSDAPTSEEQKEFSTDRNPGILKRGALGVMRIAAEPIANAAIWYGKAAQGKIPNATEQALSVAPEAMGQGAGSVIAGKMIESAPKAIAAIPDAAKASVPYVTAPIRYGARAAEAVANSKLRPFAKVMTPADEALTSRVKIPGRDVGLPGPEPVYPGAPQPTATPEQLNPALASEARTLPGQVGPEVIGPHPEAAAPIPPRSGLMLPSHGDAILRDMAPYYERLAREGHGPEVPEPEEEPEQYAPDNTDLNDPDKSLAAWKQNLARVRSDLAAVRSAKRSARPKVSPNVQ